MRWPPRAASPSLRVTSTLPVLTSCCNWFCPSNFRFMRLPAIRVDCGTDLPFTIATFCQSTRAGASVFTLSTRRRPWAGIFGKMHFDCVAQNVARAAIEGRACGGERDAVAGRQQARHIVARGQIHLDAPGIDCIAANGGVARAVHISRCHDGLDRAVGPHSRNNLVRAERNWPLRACQIMHLRMAAGDKALGLKLRIQLHLQFFGGQFNGRLLRVDIPIISTTPASRWNNKLLPDTCTIFSRQCLCAFPGVPRENGKGSIRRCEAIAAFRRLNRRLTPTARPSPAGQWNVTGLSVRASPESRSNVKAGSCDRTGIGAGLRSTRGLQVDLHFPGATDFPVFEIKSQALVQQRVVAVPFFSVHDDARRLPADPGCLP